MYFQAFNPLVTDWFLMYFSFSLCYSWPSFDRTSPKLSRSSACRCGCRRTIWVRKKYEKKVSFLSWPIVPFHSVLFLHKWVSWFCCELSLLYSMFFMWSLLYHFLYFSLVSNWPWFLELFLCLLHPFYLSFWNSIYCVQI